MFVLIVLTSTGNSRQNYENSIVNLNIRILYNFYSNYKTFNIRISLLKYIHIPSLLHEISNF